MILLNNVAEEIGWTGFVFARFQDRHGPLRAALLTTVFFWLFHVPSFYVETRSWATTALVLGIFLLPHLSSRLITGWLYNGAGSSVLFDRGPRSGKCGENRLDRALRVEHLHWADTE